MRNCPNSSRLTALREGWLKPHEVRALLVHMQGCAACRQTMAELDAVVGLLAADAGRYEEPPGGFQALLRSTVAMWLRLPAPVRGFYGWFRRGVAAAAIVLLVSGVLLVADQVNRVTPAPDRVPAVTVAPEGGDMLDYLIEEHAMATDRVPFSDSAYLALKAGKDEWQ